MSSHKRLAVNWDTIDTILVGQRYINNNYLYQPMQIADVSDDFYIDISLVHTDNLHIIVKALVFLYLK